MKVEIGKCYATGTGNVWRIRNINTADKWVDVERVHNGVTADLPDRGEVYRWHHDQDRNTFTREVHQFGHGGEPRKTTSTH